MRTKHQRISDVNAYRQAQWEKMRGDEDGTRTDRSGVRGINVL